MRVLRWLRSLLPELGPLFPVHHRGRVFCGTCGEQIGFGTAETIMTDPDLTQHHCTRQETHS
jgi:hypothetical protein